MSCTICSPRTSARLVAGQRDGSGSTLHALRELHAAPEQARLYWYML